MYNIQYRFSCVALHIASDPNSQDEVWEVGNAKMRRRWGGRRDSCVHVLEKFYWTHCWQIDNVWDILGWGLQWMHHLLKLNCIPQYKKAPPPPPNTHTHILVIPPNRGQYDTQCIQSVYILHAIGDGTLWCTTCNTCRGRFVYEYDSSLITGDVTGAHNFVSFVINVIYIRLQLIALTLRVGTVPVFKTSPVW